MATNIFECPFCCNEECDNSIKITCPHCHYYCCLNCAEYYLKEQKVAYVCPNDKCKKSWDFNFIYKNFPKSFINNELKKNYAEMCYIIDIQQFLQHYLAEVDFCKKLNKTYQILIDNKINFQELYDYLGINIGDDNEITKLEPDKLQILTNTYDLVKDYISIELLAKIFSINYHDDMYLLYLYYNLFKNKSIKNNIENIIEHYHVDYFDYHIWFIIDFQFMNDEEQNLYELAKETKNYYIKKIFDKIQQKSFQENYEYVKSIIKRLNIKYQQDKYRQFRVGKCFSNSCDGDVYRFKDQIVCNLCQKVFCAKCHVEIYPEKVEHMIDYQIELIPNPLYKNYTKEQKEEKHECKQEDLDTVKLTTEDVKNCPNPECKQPIQKNGGCDHMWCPICKTMFNWSTGEITKSTTNPHYFQWLRQTGQSVPRFNHPDADPFYNCNIQLNREQCNRIIDRYIKSDIIKFKNFASNIELKMIDNNNDEMRATRAEYAYGVIDDKEFANKISTYYMDKFFTDNYNSIIINTIYMISEFFRKIEQDHKITDETLLQMKSIIDIHNEGVKEIYEMYPSVHIQLIDIVN